MNWIEINLPWSEPYDANTAQPEYIEHPSLDEEVKEHFGYTEAELVKKYFGEGFDYYINSKVFNEYHKLSNKILDYEDEADRDRQLLALNNKSVNATLEFFAKVRPINQWLEEHPTTRLINDKNAAISAAFKAEQKKNAKSFTGRGLAKSGVLMEVKIAGDDNRLTKMLIGDINESGGVCDDCRGISQDDIVIRYCVLWEDNENHI